ncbi:hypothetical protein [Rubrobacter aplysinae]|uniref:hypothetical protein n=1 Tax=Rubrobacter aplysinae TaxID=909625 RepID=UPI00064C01F9|nr:hypothetical protein [Rubrobacter aplysinae]
MQTGMNRLEDKAEMSRRLGPASLVALGMLVALLAAAAPAAAQENPSGAGTVDVTFELTVDGEVAEGRTLGLDLPGTADIGGTFCSTAAPDARIPRCEAGETYTATFFSIGNNVSTGPLAVAAGETRSYEYTVSNGQGLIETFEAGTITPTEDTTVSATYQAGDQGDQNPPQDQYGPGDENGDPGNSEDQYENDPVAPPSGSGSPSESSGSPGASSSDSNGSGGLSILPDTGGASLLALGAGAMLVASGLIARRMTSQR